MRSTWGRGGLDSSFDRRPPTEDAYDEAAGGEERHAHARAARLVTERRQVLVVRGGHRHRGRAGVLRRQSGCHLVRRDGLRGVERHRLPAAALRQARALLLGLDLGDDLGEQLGRAPASGAARLDVSAPHGRGQRLDRRRRRHDRLLPRGRRLWDDRDRRRRGSRRLHARDTGHGRQERGDAGRGRQHAPGRDRRRLGQGRGCGPGRARVQRRRLTRAWPLGHLAAVRPGTGLGRPGTGLGHQPRDLRTGARDSATRGPEAPGQGSGVGAAVTGGAGRADS